ncbi:MAG: maleylpyruvate isomerase N-terminal domain-containing protein, partial [Acidimicrobiia bacterium]
MHEILAEVVAEQQSLDQYLQSIKDRDWAKKTPHNRWTIRQHVAHLATFEEYALDAIEAKGARLSEINDFPTFDAFVKDTSNRGPKRSQEVIEWWRLSRAAVIDALSHRDA